MANHSTLATLPGLAAIDAATEFARHALSPAILRAYKAAWADFTA